MSALYRGVAGHCPMGCGETLMLDYAGQVYCANLSGCPDYLAVTKLLRYDSSEPQHVLTVREDEWVLRHPLSDRIEPRGLEDCHYNRLADDLVREYAPGRYRMMDGENGRYLEIIAEGE